MSWKEAACMRIFRPTWPLQWVIYMDDSSKIWKFRKSSSIFENIFLKRYRLWSCAVSCFMNFQKYFFKIIFTSSFWKFNLSKISRYTVYIYIYIWWDDTVIYQCIAIHHVVIHVLIQQNEYQYIDIAEYWSMNYFLQWIKLWNWHFTENSCEINLVQYGDSHGFILSEEIILLLSVS